MSGPNPNYCSESFRLFLKEVVRQQLTEQPDKPYNGKLSAVLRQQIITDTGISRASLESMIYRGEGGMDAWVKLLLYIYHLNGDQFSHWLVEMAQQIQQKRPIQPGEMKWQQLGNRLSEDRKLFWHDMIETVEGITNEK